ncbi:Dynamitin-domain-containing protein [Scheffersomyces xylosifermentans]|uniref:Dynamitin-domain-containing protein n=1 Tax=Scheffersomyces xylosifermentans TaxID=1304137 RepID=UPI00315D5B5D
MEKYSDLPDIETNSQDVFETSDLESDLDLPHEDVGKSETDNEEIDRGIDINTNEARSKFANSIIVGSGNEDFSGTVVVPVLGKSGYLVESVEETRKQKLTRIARELEELKVSEDSGKDEVNAPESTQIKKLSDQLESVLSNDKVTDKVNLHGQQLKQLFEQVSRNVANTGTLQKSEEKREIVNPSEVLSLEARIHDLESLLGADSLQNLHRKPGKVNPYDSVASIQTHLNDLSRKVNIVHNPEYHIELVSREIEALTTKMDELESKRKFQQIRESAIGKTDTKANSTPFEKKIDELYKALPNFEKSNQVVPLILNRLKSLNTVHSDLATTTQTVGQLDRILGDLKEDFQNWDKSLNTVNENIDKYEVNFEENRASITRQIDELERKVMKLENKQ